MREHRYFFGVPLTHFDCLGWAIREAPFEIIVNRTRGTSDVKIADWLNDRDPPFALACFFAAIVDLAEQMDEIKPPFDDGMCDGAPGLSPLADKTALHKRYSQQVASVLFGINILMRALPEVVQFSLNSTKDSNDFRWMAEVYIGLKEFFATVKQYWPEAFNQNEKIITAVLQLPAFSECRLSEQKLSQLPEQARKYLEDVARELFKLKFSWRDRPDYRQTK